MSVLLNPSRFLISLVSSQLISHFLLLPFYYCRFTIVVFLLVSSQLTSCLRLAAVFLLMSSRLINSYPFVLILPASSLMSPNSYPGIEVRFPYVQISAICPLISFPSYIRRGGSAHIYLIPDYLLS